MFWFHRIFQFFPEFARLKKCGKTLPWIDYIRVYEQFKNDYHEEDIFIGV